MINRTQIWIVSLVIALGLSFDCDALKRDYYSSNPEICCDHLGRFGFNHRELRDYVGLIPTNGKTCRCIDCSACRRVWWQEWEDEDGDTVGYFWNCNCKYQEDDLGWDGLIDEWSWCRKPAIYQGYFAHTTYSPLLKDHLIYTKENGGCRCTWPETSTQAATISDKAYDLFHALLTTTALRILEQQAPEQRRFLNTPDNIFYNFHGLTISLIAHCFFYSHYECVLDDLEAYSKTKFDSQTHSLVCNKLDDIREALWPLFLNLYERCIAAHPNERMIQERDYLLSKLGYNLSLDRCDVNSSGDVKIVFCRDDDETSNFVASLDYLTDALEEQDLAACDIKPMTNSTHPLGELRVPLGPKQQFDRRVASNYYLEEGISLSEQLRFSEAIASFSEAVSADPSNSTAYIERALAYFELGELDLALADYRIVKGTGGPIRTLSSDYPTSLSAGPENFQLALDAEQLECARGLCVGVVHGAGTYAIEFVPSTLSTVKGLGIGLWAFLQDPVLVGNDLVNAVNDMMYFLRYEAKPEMLVNIIPELRELIDTWEHKSSYERGRLSGFIIGKYGVDVFVGAGSIKLIHKFRNLKRANAMTTLECCHVSEVNHKRILAEVAIRDAQHKKFRQVANLKIQWGKQNKHITSAHNYRPGRSILEHRNPQALIDQRAGTGSRAAGTVPGSPGYVEIVEFGEFIGYCVLESTGEALATTRGTIHYAKDGVHIVPRPPVK